MSNTQTCFSKILADRLNHLKSDLASLIKKKMDKRITNEHKIAELKIRISEVEFFQQSIDKNKASND